MTSLFAKYPEGELVPMPTLPLLVAKLAPVVDDNAPVTARPVEENVPIKEPLAKCFEVNPYIPTSRQAEPVRL
jgi:hypothetical protein